MKVELWNPATEPSLPVETVEPTCWVSSEDPGEVVAALIPAMIPPRHVMVVVACGEDIDEMDGPIPDWIIPALLIRQQSDLADVPKLLAVQAKRRALVVECGHDVDLHDTFCCADKYGIDFVILIAPSGAWDIQNALVIAAQCRAAGVPVACAGPVGRAYEDDSDKLLERWYRDWPAQIPQTLEIA